MTKADIVKRFQERAGFTQKECAPMVETVFETMRKALESGENVKISRFGIFSLRQKAARRGRNPHTGEGMTITPRRVLTFKPSPQLKASINGETVNKRVARTTETADKPPSNPLIHRDWRKRPSLHKLQNISSAE